MSIFKLLPIAALCIFLYADSFAQLYPDRPLQKDPAMDAALAGIVQRLGLDTLFDAGEDGWEYMSLAVIDLNQQQPVYGGYHEDNFIYPASVYKMYVAMEVLQQAYLGKFGLYDPFVVASPNDVDKTKEIDWDPRPLLRNGDTVTVRYLLDLMITRSDNTAANCLIDLAGRPAINETMRSLGWAGSEVTRKFLKRSVEAAGYDTIRSTETNAKHAAEFMVRIANGTLINPWVSRQLEILLGAQLDTTKLSAGLPADAVFYHKTGWWGPFTHDVGIVRSKDCNYIIACFLPLSEALAVPKMKELAKEINALMQQRKPSGIKREKGKTKKRG